MKILDKIIPTKKEIEEQEYPEEYEPNPILKTKDPDIKEFLRKKQEREEKKHGKEDPTQEDIPEQKEESIESVPEKVEESQEIEERTEPTGEEKITYTTSFNMLVNKKNIETSKRLLGENVKNGFVVAFQAGTYVDNNNVENIKRALKYFVDNNYKVVIATEQVQEIPDDK